MPLRRAADSVPDRPGLYAIYGDAQTWSELGLGEPPDMHPLYVGKAEASLVTRDLRTHFSDGPTGQSTVRRSFAALLREELSLEARGVLAHWLRPLNLKGGRLAVHVASQGGAQGHRGPGQGQREG